MNGFQLNAAGAAYFVNGGLSGLATLYGGPLAGAAVLGAGNNIIDQVSSGKKFDFGQVIQATVISVAITAATLGVGKAIFPTPRPPISAISTLEPAGLAGVQSAALSAESTIVAQATNTGIANTASSAAVNAPKELAKGGIKLISDCVGRTKLPASFGIQNLDAVNVVGKSGTTVLGKFPNYINLANQLGANRFSIPKNIFNKMSPTQQWNANTKFLDRAILRNDDIFLSDSPLDLNKFNGAFKKEIEYMMEKGFKVNSTGTKLLNH